MAGKATEIRRYDAPGGEILIPVAAVEGANSGPHAVITAGVHGCEYPGIVAAVRLFRSLDPKKVHGTVTIVTISSTAAFEERRMFVSPVDCVNLNRVFPGRLDGSYSEVLAYRLLEIIREGDLHIDLHGGDMVEHLEPFSLYRAGDGGRVESESREIAAYCGLPNIVSTSAGGSWDDSGTTYANAAACGVPSAIVEAGGAGILDEASVQMHSRGLENVLRRFGCLDGDARKPSGQREFCGMVWVYTKRAGIFRTRVRVGEVLSEGEPLGHVEDWFGETIETVASPATGRVLFATSSPAVKEHGLVFGIGV